jgi:hypothetical protein
VVNRGKSALFTGHVINAFNGAEGTIAIKNDKVKTGPGWLRPVVFPGDVIFLHNNLSV